MFQCLNYVLNSVINNNQNSITSHVINKFLKTRSRYNPETSYFFLSIEEGNILYDASSRLDANFSASCHAVHDGAGGSWTNGSYFGCDGFGFIWISSFGAL